MRIIDIWQKICWLVISREACVHTLPESKGRGLMKWIKQFNKGKALEVMK